MVFVQINLPPDLDHWVDVEDAKRGIKNKKLTIVKILEEVRRND